MPSVLYLCQFILHPGFRISAQIICHAGVLAPNRLFLHLFAPRLELSASRSAQLFGLRFCNWARVHDGEVVLVNKVTQLRKELAKSEGKGEDISGKKKERTGD